MNDKSDKQSYQDLDVYLVCRKDLKTQTLNQEQCMCRLAAYVGAEIPLERIIVQPDHSLLVQSHHANEAKLSVNGDGFGFAWYFGEKEPGLYRDVLPAWSDGNLSSICKAVSAPLFLAHVRASTEGEVSRSNCHPFAYKNWSFAHNGKLGGFSGIRRVLESALSDHLYLSRRGTTDSELLFLLLLHHGLEQDVQAAVQATLEAIWQAQSSGQSTRQPNRITCVFSDGASVYGLRTACDNKSPSLYYCDHPNLPGTLLASEPLDEMLGRWIPIEEDNLVVLRPNATIEKTVLGVKRAVLGIKNTK